MNPLLAHRLLNRAAFLGTFGKGPSQPVGCANSDMASELPVHSTMTR